jgi:hypothetical protein
MEIPPLSACDAGRGKITGDRLIGLSRSWMMAGVPGIVVSLRQAMLTTKQTYPDPLNWASDFQWGYRNLSRSSTANRTIAAGTKQTTRRGGNAPTLIMVDRADKSLSRIFTI